jgi:hypothetical protein
MSSVGGADEDVEDHTVNQNGSLAVLCLLVMMVVGGQAT